MKFTQYDTKFNDNNISGIVTYHIVNGQVLIDPTDNRPYESHLTGNETYYVDTFIRTRANLYREQCLHRVFNKGRSGHLETAVANADTYEQAIVVFGGVEYDPTKPPKNAPARKRGRKTGSVAKVTSFKGTHVY